MSLNINTLHKIRYAAWNAWLKISNDLYGDRFYLDDEGLLWGIGSFSDSPAYYWDGRAWVQDANQ